MTFERFSQLWDALVTNRPKATEAQPIPNGMKNATASALIAYGQGNKTEVNRVRAMLGREPAN